MNAAVSSLDSGEEGNSQSTALRLRSGLAVQSQHSPSAPTDELAAQLPPLFSRIRIVLSHTSHPGNIGAAARAMKTMGLSRLVLVNPKTFPDAQADAMAAGANDLLANAQVVASLSEALVGTTLAIALTARRRELAAPPMWAADAATEVVTHAGEVALVFGNETFGLSNEEIARCQLIATVPTNPAYGSLNVAQAVQLAAYELSMAAALFKLAAESARETATSAELEALFAHLEQHLITTEFLDPQKPKRLMLRLRRLFVRAKLEREEVAILRGVIAATQKYNAKNTDK